MAADRTSSAVTALLLVGIATPVVWHLGEKVRAGSAGEVPGMTGAAAGVDPDGRAAFGEDRDRGTGSPEAAPWAPPTASVSSACPDAGYLCAELPDSSPIRVLRFSDDTRGLTVRVPEPAHEEPGLASALRAAAVRGIQTWDGHPFPIRFLDGEEVGSADVEIEWASTLDGTRLGVARTSFRSGPSGLEYRVDGLALVTRIPGAADRPLDVGNVELAAAHEMGHVLGLPHSDDPRDLMFPRNTASRPTARDYRTLDALYRMAPGTEITR